MKACYLNRAISSSADAKTNQLSLFQILDEIAASTFPSRLASFCLASLFRTRPTDDPVQSHLPTASLDDTFLASAGPPQIERPQAAPRMGPTVN